MSPDRPSEVDAEAAWVAVDGDRLVERIAGWIDAAGGAPRVAIDGPPCAQPSAFADALVPALRALGRETVRVRAGSFWRDASLRLEHGREDVESYRTWLDDAALQRETLEPFGAGRAYLTSLRDPATNRSTREAPRAFVAGSVLLVDGTFLVGSQLSFDRTLHLFLPPAARARRTPPGSAWTLPAFDEHDRHVRPAERADVTVRLDRRSPAVRGLP